jgi:hypothetical protein
MRYGAIAFWIILAAVAFLLSKVLGIIVAILVGAVVGGAAAFFLLRLLNRFLPKEPNLILHQNHLPPDELRCLAAIADNLSRLTEWTDLAETEIDALEKNKTYDEEFEDVVIEAGFALKEAFSGCSGAATGDKRSRWSAPKMSAIEWRTELEAIAHDIRLAAGEFESRKGLSGPIVGENT